MPGVPIYRNPGLLSFRIPFTIETRTLYIACATNLTVVEWEAVTGTIMFRRIPESQEGYRMENKKAQALDDDLLENIIGGISLRGVFTGYFGLSQMRKLEYQFVAVIIYATQ